MMRQRALIGLAAVALSPSPPAATTTTTPPPPSHRRHRAGRRRAATAAASTPASAPAAPHGDAVVAGEPFPEDRCAANEAAGTITYLSGFDFAATASIIDVVVAEQAGYFDDLCLDVELTAELLDGQLPARRRRRRPDRVRRLVQRGRRLRHGQRRRARRRRRRGPHGDRQPDPQARRRRRRWRSSPGTTIGVKGKIPPSVAAMLAGAGLVEGTDYQTVLLDGFDPLAHYAPRRHRRVPRLQEQRAGPARAGRPAVRPVRPDRVRRPGLVRRALHDRASSPRSTRRRCRTSCGRRCGASPTPSPTRRRRRRRPIDLVEANGNPSFLSLEGESFRWATDAELLPGETPDGTGIGVPDLDAAAGRGRRLRRGRPVRRRARPTPPSSSTSTPIAGVYDDAGHVIWPALTRRLSCLAAGPPAPSDSAARNTRIGEPAATCVNGPSAGIIARCDRSPPRRLGRVDRPRRPLRHVRDRGPRHPDAGVRQRRRRTCGCSGSRRRCSATRLRRLRGRALHVRRDRRPRAGARPPPAATSTASAPATASRWPCATTPSGSSATGRSRRSAPPSSG